MEERALLDVLRSGRLAGAALDVFWEEPLPADHELLRMNNVTMTPHVAGSTTTSEVTTALNLSVRVLKALYG